MAEKYGDWIPRSEVARRLGLSINSIIRAVKIKKLRAAKRATVGRRALVVIHPGDVEAAEAEMQGKRPVTASNGDGPRLFLTLAQAAEYTGLSVETLGSFMVSGKLAFLELDEGQRVRRRDLDAL